MGINKVMKKIILPLLFMFALIGCTSVTFNGYHYPNADAYSKYEDKVYIDSDIKNLDIDWIAGEITIQCGYSFTISEENTGRNYLPLYYYQNDHSGVEIKYCKSNTTNSDLNDTSKKLVVTVPSELEKINLKTISANYTIEIEHANEINIDSISGNGVLKINTLDSATIKSISGKIDCTIEDSTYLNKIDINTLSGRTDLYFDGLKGYSLTFESISGEVNKEFDEDISADKFAINFKSISSNLNIHKLTGTK